MHSCKEDDTYNFTVHVVTLVTKSTTLRVFMAVLWSHVCQFGHTPSTHLHASLSLSHLGSLLNQERKNRSNYNHINIMANSCILMLNSLSPARRNQIVQHTHARGTCNYCRTNHKIHDMHMEDHRGGYVCTACLHTLHLMTCQVAI